MNASSVKPICKTHTVTFDIASSLYLHLREEKPEAASATVCELGQLLLTLRGFPEVVIVKQVISIAPPTIHVKTDCNNSSLSFILAGSIAV